jgi:4-hydroxybenzoate polyprenyltransferase
MNQPLVARLWVYQAERFPLIRTAPLVAAFSAASVTASANLAGRALPHFSSYLVAFILSLTFFWQMRAADEMKDAETDRRYRPERPIPRGLVSLKLILWLGGLASLPALTAAYLLTPKLLAPLALVWTWLALMTAEFFAPEFLRARPGLYLLSHMAIMPLIDLTLTACEWLTASALPAFGIWTFLWMSFCNGSVLEFGRKIWSPEQERPGVDTYSSSWGAARALIALAVAALGALFGLIACGVYCGRPLTATSFGVVAFSYLAFEMRRFHRHPSPAAQKRMENASGVWVLVCYCAAAAAPFVPTVTA